MPTPLVLPDSLNTAAGTSRRTYRHRLARELGLFMVATVTSRAAGPELERYVISTAAQSDAAPRELFDGLFLYVTSGAEAGQQRRLVSRGWDGPLGALVVDYPFDAALAPGSTFELSVLPAEEYLGTAGLNDLLNEALETLPVIDYTSITLTATGGVPDTEYSLADYEWPIKSVQAVCYPRTSTASERRREMPRRWDFVQDAEAPILSFRELPGQVGDEIDVKLHRPAHTRIRQGGIWADTTEGLADDDDEALYDVRPVVAAAKPIARQRQAQMYPLGSKERAALEDLMLLDERRAQVSKFYASFQGGGAQKAGAR